MILKAITPNQSKCDYAIINFSRNIPSFSFSVPWESALGAIPFKLLFLTNLIVQRQNSLFCEQMKQLAALAGRTHIRIRNELERWQ